MPARGGIMSTWNRIPGHEMMYGYRAEVGLHTVEVVCCYAGQWAVFHSFKGSFTTPGYVGPPQDDPLRAGLGGEEPYARAMAAGRRLVKALEDR